MAWSDETRPCSRSARRSTWPIPRLRKLAAALGPAYVRVSGTWANSAFFADTATPPSTAPKGFDGVLSRTDWSHVLDFALARRTPSW
ncbi:hypothetical protein [Rhodanobacter lindaniclasticus]